MRDIFVGLGVGFIIMSCIISLIIEKGKIEKENARLHQQIIDYKWQLEQVSYVLDYGCKNG